MGDQLTKAGEATRLKDPGQERHSESAVSARLVSRLKMRHLLLLKSMERHSSLTAVAREAGISQPAVTKTLAEIESLFGAPLFHRTARGLTPNEMGELAMRRATHMLRDLQHWSAEMEAVKRGHRARLLIGAVPYVPGSLLTEAITVLMERHNVIISLRHATTDHLVQALCDHEIDCVLGRASAIAGRADLRHEVLYVQRPVLVGHAKLIKRLQGRKLDWRALASMNWMLPSPATPVGAKMVELFTRAQVPVPVPIIETYSLDVMHGVLSRNESVISVVPEDIAEEMKLRGGIGVLSWAGEWELPPLSLIRRVRETPLHAEDRFSEILRELCGPPQ